MKPVAMTDLAMQRQRLLDLEILGRHKQQNDKLRDETSETRAIFKGDKDYRYLTRRLRWWGSARSPRSLSLANDPSASCPLSPPEW